MAPEAPLIRAFVAVPVPEDIRRKLGVVCTETLGDLTHLRPVNARNIHVTLKFLGEIGRDALHAVERALHAVAGRHTAFDLRVEGVRTLPTRGDPRVVFADLLGPVDRLALLARDIEDVAAQAGIAREDRPFTAHLTLARIKSPKQLGLLRKRIETVATQSFGVLPVREIVLYRSELDPAGARYTAVGGAALRDR
ncbi:MAG: RNA 2',3'-cyclic phosphodiesterase [Deltaproteobacteria bacterium]|nr:RNA 2',3'-cyclic phosphodiesterase [Deltaproteobacteria bacterium]